MGKMDTFVSLRIILAAKIILMFMFVTILLERDSEHFVSPNQTLILWPSAKKITADLASAVPEERL